MSAPDPPASNVADHSPGPARDPALDRYSRQVLFEHVGPDAQRRLGRARVTLIGCGALGTVLADQLVRAGLGSLRLVDRDYVELNNLQRQVLFDEQDVADSLPKAAAAAARLARVNSTVRVEPCIVDANRTNIESLIADADLVVDGTDNFETRFLINDACVKHRKPWVYGACIGATGLVLPILPGETPCLRCIWEEPPPPGMSPTCDTAGVLAPTVHLVAALQAVEALKLLMGRRDAVIRRLIQIDAWSGRFDAFDMQPARHAGVCPCCAHGRYDYLDGRAGGGVAVLCGRDAVQVAAPATGRVDFDAIAQRVAPVASTAPRVNRFMLRFSVGRYDVTVFADGRAIIKGTHEPDEARTVYAKYVGA